MATLLEENLHDSVFLTFFSFIVPTTPTLSAGSSWELAFHLFRGLAGPMNYYEFIAWESWHPAGIQNPIGPGEMTTWGQVNPNVVVYGALLRSSRWREQSGAAVLKTCWVPVGLFSEHELMWWQTRWHGVRWGFRVSNFESLDEQHTERRFRLSQSIRKLLLVEGLKTKNVRRLTCFFGFIFSGPWDDDS